MDFFKFQYSIGSFVSLGVILGGMASSDDQIVWDLFRKAKSFA